MLRRTGHRGRFAPSPTGPLHLGNLRTALLAWLEARLRGGEFLLRFDDLDTPRNRAGAEADVQADLLWLGLDWDGPALRQSERTGLYASVLSALRRRGSLYPCRCSRRMLADLSAPHGGWALYPGTCRRRPPQWGPMGGRLPSWRLRLEPGLVTWPEETGGSGCLEAATGIGDVVLRRADGFVAYHLATAVDELALGIGTVLRGVDLLMSSGPQVAVMRQLGMEPPRYWHVPLWLGADGQRLAKRLGGEGLAELRQQGMDAAGVVGLLAGSLGLVPAASRLSAVELLQELSLEALRVRLRKPGNHSIS